MNVLSDEEFDSLKRGGKFRVLSEEEFARLAPPGYSPLRPIEEQHPALTLGQREMMKNIVSSHGEEKMGGYLQGLGFEVKPRGGGRFSIRKPGESRWMVVDPDRAEWADIADVGGDIYRLALQAGGGLAGAVAGSGLSPGVGTAAGIGIGGALGGGAAEGHLQALGRLAGLKTTPGEIASSVGREALIGGASELAGAGIGAAVGAAGRGIRHVKAGLARTSEEIMAPAWKELPTEIATKNWKGLKGNMAKETMAELAGKKVNDKVLNPRQIAQRELQRRLSSQPFAETSLKAKRQLIKEALEQAPKTEPITVTWRPQGMGTHSEAGQLLTRTIQKAPPPGYQFKGKPPSHNPMYQSSVWDKSTGDWSTIDFDTIAKMEVGGQTLNFEKPNVVAKFARRILGSKPARFVGKGFKVAGEAAEFAGNLPVYAGRFAGRYMRRRPFSPVGSRVGLGFVETALMGAPWQSLAAYSASKAAPALTRVSKTLLGDGGETVLRIMGNAATPGHVRKVLSAALKARVRGPSAYKATMYVLLQNPILRQYLMSQEGQAVTQ